MNHSTEQGMKASLGCMHSTGACCATSCFNLPRVSLAGSAIAALPLSHVHQKAPLTAGVSVATLSLTLQVKIAITLHVHKVLTGKREWQDFHLLSWIVLISHMRKTKGDKKITTQRVTPCAVSESLDLNWTA